MARSRILIVDDEIIIARELESRLKSMGYEVPGIASSGNEAIQCVRDMKPDLVLMDIVLKGELDGIEAATILRQHHHVPVIYVTAYADDKTLERAKITEPFGYIVKPFSERELNANIEMALYRHRTELRLKRLERWFANAAREQSIAVIAADHEGRITSLNGNAELLTACTHSHAVGRPIQEVLRLVDRQNGAPVSFDTILEGPVVGLASDTLLLDQEDAAVPVDSTTALIRDEADRPVGWISVVRDASGKHGSALASLGNEIALAVAESISMQGMLKLCAESLVRNLDAAFARIWLLDARKDVLILRASAGMYRRLDGHYGKIAIGDRLIGTIAK